MMVGRIIKPSRIPAVSTFLPETPVKFCMMGTITTKPKNPYTIEGIPASRETAGFKTLYSFSGVGIFLDFYKIRHIENIFLSGIAHSDVFASRNSRWTQSILFHRCFHPLNNHNVKSSGYFPIGIQTHCESVYYHSTSVKPCQLIFFSYS